MDFIRSGSRASAGLFRSGKSKTGETALKNFRRIISVLCAAAMLLSLCACSKREKYDVVFITDVGDIYDRSYNSAVWDGVRSYVADYGVNCKYYRPSQRGTKYFSKAIKKAINHGAGNSLPRRRILRCRYKGG